MSINNGWDRLTLWSPWLFVFAAVCLVVGAVNSGLAFLSNGYSFNEWLGLVLELGRVAALLGAAGVSVQIVKQRPWVGNVTRAIASIAVVFVTALTVLATLEKTGVLTDPIGVIGLVAYVLSVSTFLTVGAAVVKTGSHSRLVGGLLLVNVVALLAVFFGRLFVPLNLLAAVVPAGQVLLYLGISHDLRSRETAVKHRTPATDMIP